MMTGPRLRWAAALVGWLALSSPFAWGGDDRDQLLATARDGNRAAIQSITTMECRYERIPWAGTTLDQAKKCFFFPVSPGRFWRSGEVYRLMEPNDDGTSREYVVRNGRIQVLRKKGRPVPWSTLSLNTPGPVDGVGGEIWQYLLFSHWWGKENPGFYPFWDIIQQPYTLHTVERLPSREIHVDLSHAGGRWEFWFDPEVNYLVHRSVVIPAETPRSVLNIKLSTLRRPARRCSSRPRWSTAARSGENSGPWFGRSSPN